MAGHSKFKNIMHRKGAQDKKRANFFHVSLEKFQLHLKSEGVDPDANPRLRGSFTNNALSSNMSKDSIQKAINKNQANSENEQFLKLYTKALDLLVLQLLLNL